MRTMLSRFMLAAACLSLGAAANAAVFNPGPMSVHPESMTGEAIAAPTLGPVAAALPELPALPAIPAQPQAATPAAPTAMSGLEQVAAPFAAGMQEGPRASADVQLTQAFDGARAIVPASDLDGSGTWLDDHTGQWETQQTKVRKAFQLAMSHPVAAAMKNGMTQNTVYKVDNSGWSSDVGYVARSYGDDPEHPNEPAMVVFTREALKQLSPAALAAHLAKMWTFHKYRDAVPASAEKTYMGHSVMIRVFKSLTNSQGQQYWNYDQDMPTWNSIGQRTFAIFSHWFHWSQGFSFQNVRQGPYFLNKIMRSEGDPAIDTDARGRMTLHQREQAQQIDGQKATNAQGVFDGFVSNEQ